MPQFDEAIYYYDADEPNRVIRFFRKFLRHIDGDLIGKPIEPLPWVVDLIQNVYGVKHKDTGLRRYTETYIELPRKQAKSINVAALALYELVFGEHRGEVIVGAKTREQATHLFKYASDLVRMSPQLREMVTIYRNHMHCGLSNSIFKVVSRDADNLQGANISCGIVDELHVQPDNKLYSGIQLSQGLRKQPLLFGITTAGIVVKNNFAWDKHEHAKAVLAGKSKDETLYVKIYGLELDEDWHSEDNWIRVNPIVTTVPSYLKRLRDMHTQAVESKEMEIEFRRFHLNQWLQSVSCWITDDVWMKAADPCVRLEDLAGVDCYVAIDLSTSTDLTSVSVAFKYDGKGVMLFNHCFCPLEGIRKRSRKDKVPYEAWAKEGFITPTDGDATDYDAVLAYIQELDKTNNVKQIAFDPWGATYFSQALQKAGFNVVKFGQGFRSMSPATKNFERLLLRNELHHDGANKLLRWAMGNVALENDAAGNIKPSKKRSQERIDPAVSSIMAVEIATADDVEENAADGISWT